MGSAPNWSGFIDTRGYLRVRFSNKQAPLHVHIAEAALGRPLRGTEQIHHVNEIKTDNSPSNLVICPANDYHRLLHVRTAALEACGNANWLKCQYCKVYDDRANMIVQKNRASRYANRAHHAKCSTEYRRTLYLRRKVGQ